MNSFLSDVRYALRVLLKSPGFAAVAILTLALGIGANTAIFSVVNAVLLRPLPYPEADRLVFLSEWSEQVPGMSISMANFNDWRAQNSVFEAMAAYNNVNVVLTGRGEPERLRVRQITAGLFPTLRVKPILGRPLLPDDDKVGAAPVVLLNENFWERRFGRDPGIIDQPLNLDGQSFTVIGVLPTLKMHGSLRQVDLFTSLGRLEDRLGGETNRDSHPGIYSYARLKSGVTVEQARTEMTGIAARLAQQHPQTNTGNTAHVDSLLNAIVEDVRPSLIFLMAAVGFVLLIACVNIANLLLSRATERHRELAVRIALGASRWRVVRQLLTECILLALAGGGFGLFLAVWITAALSRAPFPGVPRLDEVSADRWVLGFTFGLSVLTGLLFGLFPAVHGSRADVNQALKEGGRTGSAGGRRGRLRDVLVATEMAVSLVLLVGAGLMAKSLLRVLEDTGGTDPSNVLTASLALPNLKYTDDAAQRAFVRDVVDKLRAIPGVEVAGFKNPLFGSWQTSFAVEGRPLPEPGHFPSTDIGRVTPDALRALGIRLLRGRYFDTHDNEQAPLVCIVDETLARQYWPNEDPIGKRLSIQGAPAQGQPIPWMTIVGVVAHVKNYGVDQPSRVETYIPYAQNPSRGGSLVIRAAKDPAELASAVRAAVHSVDADIPLFDVRLVEDIVADSSAPRRLSVTLIGSFAFLALLLAAVGIYGVMAYAVTQRRHEIGIRMALGAQPGEVLRMVLRQGMYLAIAGIAVGLVGALGMARLITNLLFQVSAHDAFTFTSGALLLAAIALLACWVPARRATRVDPVVALRYE